MQKNNSEDKTLRPIGFLVEKEFDLSCKNIQFIW